MDDLRLAESPRCIRHTCFQTALKLIRSRITKVLGLQNSRGTFRKLHRNIGILREIT